MINLTMTKNKSISTGNQTDSADFNTALFHKYLNILNVNPPKLELSRETLDQLVLSHLSRIPFENISKLYYHSQFHSSTIPDFEQYLEGIERYHFGGTCYANNYYFYLLLKNLGFRARLCGADMALSKPDVHIVIMVIVGEREYLVDVGYGAPFLKAIPRDIKSDYIIKCGRSRYVLKPQNERGESRLEHYLDDELVHGYLAKPAARDFSFFKQNIEESYLKDSHFMNVLSFAIFRNGYMISVKNLTVFTSNEISTTASKLKDRQELKDMYWNKFRIPGTIIDQTLKQLNSKNITNID